MSGYEHTAGRMAAWWIAALIFTLIITVIAPLLGDSINLATAFSDFSPTGTHETPDGLIFWQTRIPRVLTGLIAGAALACSGLAYQAVLRNPLADPYILGVSSGAAIGKSVAVLVLPATLAMHILAAPLLCFTGALLPVLFLSKVAGSARRFSPVTLLLAGAIINLILSAAMMLVQVFANPDDARKITYWWLGGLDVAGYKAPLAALPVVATGILALTWKSRSMNLLSIDSLTADHLGVNVGREVVWLLAIGTVLAATSVALCGPIGFAGLLVPHILRLAAGPDHRLLTPLCAIGGAGFLIFCDLIGWRGLEWLAAAGLQLRGNTEIPAGVITALLGGPVFLLLLVKEPYRN